MKSAVAVAVVAAAACGAPPPPTSSAPAIVHRPCGPLVVAPPEGASDMQRSAVAEALHSWNVLGFTQLTTEGEGEPIALRFEEALGFFHGLYDPDTGEVIINSTMDRPGEIAVVVAHELGHAMGLAHIERRASVMNPGNLEVPPTPEDNELLVTSCP